MSDEQNGNEQSDEKVTDVAGTPDEQGAVDDTARRPSPGATAASRARRIGGRPMPTPAARDARSVTPEAEQVTAPAAASSKAAQDKAAGKAKPAKQANPERAAAPAASAASAAPGEPRRPLPVDLVAMQRRLDRLRWIPAVIAALALVAVLVIGGWQSHGVWWGKKLADTRTEQQQRVLAAAKSCTAAILSYDYKRLDQTQSAAEACITGQFKQDYDQSFELVRTAAPQKDASQTFEVANGGVSDVSSDGKQWVVMLYGQIGYTDNTVKNGPRLDISTPIVTLTQVNGKWLVSKMDTI